MLISVVLNQIHDGNFNWALPSLYESSILKSSGTPNACSFLIHVRVGNDITSRLSCSTIIRFSVARVCASLAR